MTSKERVRTTIRHEEPDRVPYFEQAVSSRVASKILGRPVLVGGTGMHYDQVLAAMRGPDEADALHRQILDDTILMTREFGFDIIHLPWRFGGAPTKRLDEYTFLFGDEAGWWDVYRYDPVTDIFGRIDTWLWHVGEPGLEQIVAAEEKSAEDVVRPGRGMGADFEYVRDQLGPDYSTCGTGMISVPMDLVWMEAMATRPDLIERHLDAQLPFALSAIEAGADAGVDFIWGGGDLASEKGPWMSPAAFRRFHLPHLGQMVDLCHQLGVPYIFRSDGDLWPIADMLFVESGVDGYGEIDSGHGMDVAEIVEKLPHLSLWGAIDCGELLVRGTKEQVIAEVKRQIDVAGPGGGFVVMSSNAILPTTPPENFIAMMETVREYGQYPLER